MQQRLLVVAMAPGDDETVGIGGDLDVAEDLLDVAGDASLGLGEPLLVDHTLSVNHNPHVEIQIGGNRLDQYVHAAAADQAVIPPVVAIEPEFGDLRSARLKDAQASAFDFRFHTTAAPGAGLGTVRVAQHEGPWLLGRRSTGFHQPAVGHRPPEMEGLSKMFEDIVHGVARPEKGSLLRRLVTLHGRCLNL
jgi:hypothetical protein